MVYILNVFLISRTSYLVLNIYIERIIRLNVYWKKKVTEFDLYVKESNVSQINLAFQ